MSTCENRRCGGSSVLDQNQQRQQKPEEKQEAAGDEWWTEVVVVTSFALELRSRVPQEALGSRVRSRALASSYKFSRAIVGVPRACELARALRVDISSWVLIAYQIDYEQFRNEWFSN